MGDPEDADTRVDDHISDALRYVLAGLGNAPGFVIFDDSTPAAALGVVNAFGAEVLRQTGGMARRDDPYEPWTSADRHSDDDPVSRIVQRAPWA